jgi:hypothetical protein
MTQLYCLTINNIIIAVTHSAIPIVKITFTNRIPLMGWWVLAQRLTWREERDYKRLHFVNYNLYIIIYKI